MKEFKNFEDFVSYLTNTANLIEIPRNIARDDYHYTYFLVRPYRMRINGETVIVRYIVSNHPLKNINSVTGMSYYLYEELPIAFSYFYPEDKNTRLTVVKINNSSFLDTIYTYGTHGVLLGERRFNTFINELKVLNIDESF